jgi:hypothetical protein
MFTIPRAQREQLNANPIVHFVAGLVQAAAISTAQGVVDQHVSDPALAEAIKAGIESQVKAHIPVPDVNSASPLNLRPLAPLVPQIDPVASGAENAGA